MLSVRGYELEYSGAKAFGQVNRGLLLVKHFCVQSLCFPWTVCISSCWFQAGCATPAVRWPDVQPGQKRGWMAGPRENAC